MQYLFAIIILLWAGGRFLLHPRAVLKSKKGWDRTFFISVGLWFISIILIIPAYFFAENSKVLWSYDLLWWVVGVMAALGGWVCILLGYIGIKEITNKDYNYELPQRQPIAKEPPQIDIFKVLKTYKTRNAEKNGIEMIGLFGNSAKSEQTPESAIDIFIVSNTPTYSAQYPFEEELEKELGHKVNVVILSTEALPSFEENTKEIICI